MPIYSLVQTKGGCAKSTLAQCLAYSKAFQKAYDRIALVELDAQGTLNSWHAQRDNDGPVTFTLLESTSPENVKGMLQSLARNHDCLVLDVPGESRAQFATHLAVGVADAVIVPMRSSTNDEQSFVDNLWPLLRDHRDRVYIAPVFVHIQSNQSRIREYFQDIMPEGLHVLKHSLPSRGVFENYSRDGNTLHEYAKEVKTNARESKQALNAINDIEKIAREIIKHGHS